MNELVKFCLFTFEDKNMKAVVSYNEKQTKQNESYYCCIL